MSKKKPASAPLLQRFFARIFRLGYFADSIRKKNEFIFRLLTGILIGFPVLLILASTGVQNIQNPSWWALSDPITASLLLRFTLSTLLSIFITQILVGGLFPLLFYVPQSMAMKSLGLLHVSDSIKESWRLIGMCIKEHDEFEKVKIICISGRHLFREEFTPVSKGTILECPLHKLAAEGKLEVIMPASSQENVTIKNRYDTYSANYKLENGISSIEQFINEIDQGKEFLHAHGNKVYEHNILCMWRVIIFSNHCCIQNYFPNRTGAHSYNAPMFLFNKPDKCGVGHSYYDSFSHMFDLVSSC